MDYQQVLGRRRMVRDYLPRPVPPEVVDRVVSVVARAPSAGFSQGHRLLVVTDPRARAAIADIAEEPYYVSQGMPPWISRAPVHIVLGVCEADYHRRYNEADKLAATGGAEMAWQVPYWFMDAGALLMLIQLTAISEGLGSGFFTVRNVPPLRALLRIPEDIAVVGIITLGYAAPGSSPALASRIRRRRKPLDALVRHGAWDQPV